MNISDVLNFPSFYEYIKKEKMDIKTAYILTLIKKEVDFHLEFYQTELNEILSKYAQKDKNGNYIKTPDNLGISILPNCQEDCKKEVQDLLNLEITYSAPYLELSNFDNLKISPELLESILPFMKI